MQDARRDLRVVSTEAKEISFSNLIEALSFALDLTEGAIPGHALRTCVIGMRIGQQLGLPSDLISDLYYALVLKDVGCSSNSSRLFQIVGDDDIHAKQLTKTLDWTRFEWKQVHYLLRHAHAHEGGARRLRGVAAMVRSSAVNAEALIRLRCEKGARVVRDLGLGPATAGAIYCLDEHWDGRGYPDRLAGEDIPLLARIAALAQTFEVFHRMYGIAAALDVIQRRCSRWFDPSLVRVAVSLSRHGELVQGLDDSCLRQTMSALQPEHRRVLADSYTIDNTCYAFAGVVDAKSPYTFEHSSGVARVAQRMGECLNLSHRQLTTLRRAGLLHDIGKLSVSNAILDKQGKLTPVEWQSVRMHPFYTYEILRRISGFHEIAGIAASHHEKLDGTGYHRGLMGEELPLLSRILTVADMFDALSSTRPYRPSLDMDQVMRILRNEAPHAIDPMCLDALRSIAEKAAS